MSNFPENGLSRQHCQMFVLITVKNGLKTTMAIITIKQK